MEAGAAADIGGMGVGAAVGATTMDDVVVVGVSWDPVADHQGHVAETAGGVAGEAATNVTADCCGSVSGRLTASSW